MTTVNLNVPVLQGGILNTNFFNGRVLAAEDLTAFQVANAQQHHQLARSLGDGVASGLNVTLGDNTNPNNPVLHVTAGIAFNRKGEAVALGSDIDLTLVASTAAESAGAGLFAACLPPQSTVPTNLDCYILTASPASGFQGSAPMTTPSSAGFASSCSSAWAVEGVQFGLLPLGVSVTSDTTTLAGQTTQLYGQLRPLFVQLAGLSGGAASTLEAQIAPMLSQFRNMVAHLCFGTDSLAGFAANPLAMANGVSPFTTYGALDALRTQGYLSNCAVPLALVYWTAAGIQFVDMWSVRRRLTQRVDSKIWPLFAGSRRRSEAEAVFLQFEDQIQSILANETNLVSVTVDSHFVYLSPVGILPVTGDGITAVTGTPSAPALDMPAFFAAHASKDVATTDGDLLRELFSAALDYEPIQLARTGEIQLYLVWENLQSVNGGGTAPLAQVFASPAMRYRGVARFGTAKFSLSRFAPRVI